MREFVLRSSNGAYLTDDFDTWAHDAERAHRFISGAALNACVERWRRHQVRVEEAPPRPAAGLPVAGRG